MLEEWAEQKEEAGIIFVASIVVGEDGDSYLCVRVF